MRPLLWLVCLAACDGGRSTGTGVVAFTQPDTFDLAVVDVASGDTTVIDDREHGLISISPDGAWITSRDLDRQQRLYATDRRSQRELEKGEEHAIVPPTWLAGTSLLWPADGGLWFAPSAVSTARHLSGVIADVSPDGTLLAYLRFHEPITPDRRQDLIVEAVDGSGSRMLASDVAYYPLMFSADGRFIVVGAGSRTQILRYSVADGAMTELPPGQIMNVSDDGSELLVANGTELRAVEIASGTQRTVAPLPAGIELDRVSVFPLERDRVVFVQSRNVSTTDVLEFVYSIHIAGVAEDTVVRAEAPASFECAVAGVARESRYFAVSCGGVRLVGYDGTVLAADDDAATVLGVSADERGVVTLGRDHTIRYLGVGGQDRELGHVPDAFAEGVLVSEPFAAYAP